MKKQLILSAAVFGLACASVFAQGIDPVAMDRIDTIVQGKNNGDQIVDLLVLDDGLVKGDLGVGGNLAVTGSVSQTGASTAPVVNAGEVNVSTNFDISKTSITLTNGQAFSFTGSFIELSNVGDPALVTTNALTVAYPASAIGRSFEVHGASANSNSIHIAESSTLLLIGTNLTITADDVVTFKLVATNKIRQSTPIAVN